MKMHSRPAVRFVSKKRVRIRFFSSHGGPVRTMLSPSGRPPYNMPSRAL